MPVIPPSRREPRILWTITPAKSVHLSIHFVYALCDSTGRKSKHRSVVEVRCSFLANPKKMVRALKETKKGGGEKEAEPHCPLSHSPCDGTDSKHRAAGEQKGESPPPTRYDYIVGSRDTLLGRTRKKGAGCCQEERPRRQKRMTRTSYPYVPQEHAKKPAGIQHRLLLCRGYGEI